MSLLINQTFKLSENQYYKEVTEKTNICLHHTVGGSFKSTFNYWNSTPEHVATAYVIDKDGTIYEVFSPEYWAHHLGLKLPKNTLYNQRTIGIEIVSEGALRSGAELYNMCHIDKFDTDALYAFDIDPLYINGILQPKSDWFKNAKKLYSISTDIDKYTEIPILWRDYFYFDNYEENQMISVINLVKYLCDKFNIPKKFIPNADKLEFDISILNNNFKGIFTHCNVRADKSDLSPSFDWQRMTDNIK